MISEDRVIVGITGASGSVYAERLVGQLLPQVERVYLVATDPGQQVIRHELRSHNEGFSLCRAFSGELNQEEKQKIRIFKNDDYFAPIASGTGSGKKMAVVPCSMGTLARINGGMSSNLLERAADVVIKEHGNLVFCPRETPLSSLHLKNMLELSQMGAKMVPPVPAFYQKPKNMDEQIDFVVGKLLESLGYKHELYPPWNSRMI